MDTTPQEELRRTQQYLAEVIDECVFVERQRELMERRLTSQINNQRVMIDGTLGALRLLCRYTHLIEGALLPNILASLPSSSVDRQDLLRARTDADAHLKQLSALTPQGESSNSLLPPLPIADKALVGEAKQNSPPSASPHSVADALRSLLRHKEALVEALTKATSDITSIQLSATGEGAELAALRVRMDELTRLVESSAATPALDAPVATSAEAAHAVEVKTAATPASSAVRFAQARVLAYEKTTQALNNELALLHENYAALARASAVEMDRLRQKNVEAQRRHDEQVAECDAVLGRMSLELEQLIRENAQLKQKMRAAVNADK